MDEILQCKNQNDIESININKIAAICSQFVIDSKCTGYFTKSARYM